MALELPGYGRSSGATFVSKYWSEQDADMFLRALETLSGPAEKKLQARRRDNRVDSRGFFRNFSQTIAFMMCRLASLCLRKGLGQQHFSERMLRSFPGIETHRGASINRSHAFACFYIQREFAFSGLYICCPKKLC